MPNPSWFDSNISQARADHFVMVDGANIHYQTWASDAEHSLLFVHGHAAHAHWWDFIAPAFSAQYQIAALDLSGYGDSEHRDVYTAHKFGNEIATVAKLLPGKTIVIGHSFGGAMTRIAAHLFPEAMSACVLVDSIITSKRSIREKLPMPNLKRHLYKDLNAGKRRFRLKPPQPCENKYILDYIATHSLKQSIDGYEFKLDQAVFAKMEDHPGLELPDAVTMIKQMKVPSACIYGTESRFFVGAELATLISLFGEGQVLAIENAYHHVFLDQPEAFMVALKTLLLQLTSVGRHQS